MSWAQTMGMNHIIFESNLKDLVESIRSNSAGLAGFSLIVA